MQVDTSWSQVNCICVKFTAFATCVNPRAELRIRLATLRKSVRKFWFCKLELTCVDLPGKENQGKFAVWIAQDGCFVFNCVQITAEQYKLYCNLIGPTIIFLGEGKICSLLGSINRPHSSEKGCKLQRKSATCIVCKLFIWTLFPLLEQTRRAMLFK